jgi:peptidoglycan/LPS O-acetylase OafA/YrhL
MARTNSSGPAVASSLRPERNNVVVIDYLRWIAALAVVFGHVRNHLLVDYPTVIHPGLFTKAFYLLSGYGRPAVIIFFVISGFLVGGKLVQMAQAPDFSRHWPLFLVDRWSRIFIVMWPALILIGIVLSYIFVCAPMVPLATSNHWDAGWTQPLSSDLNIWRWLLNILLLNEIAGPTIFLDGPLWSLAFEWAYYMLALAVALLLRRVWSLGAAVFLAYASVLFILILNNAPEILTAGVSWIMGMMAKVASDRRLFNGRATWLGGIALVSAVLIYGRFHFIADNLYGIAVALAIAHSRWQTAEQGGRRLANFSFSLYATHAPVVAFLLVFAQKQGFLLARISVGPAGVILTLGALFVSVAFARLFAFATEDQTNNLRRWCSRRVV